MAELDEAVIDISKRYLGAIHRGAFDDPRLTLRIGDGFEFVRSTPERFDLIVLDLTDPDTPAFHLYSEQFFRMCRAILNPGGLLTLHLGSPVYQPSTVRKNSENLRKVFPQVHPMSLYIPLYGSLWCLAVASDSANPRAVGSDLIALRMRERGLTDLQYYNAELHGALFVLPNFVRDLTRGPDAAAGGARGCAAGRVGPRKAACEGPDSFVEGPLSVNARVELPAAVAHHARVVLRLREGDPIVLFNGLGGEYHAQLAGPSQAEVIGFDPVEREPSLHITLIQAQATADKVDWVIEKPSKSASPA